MRKLLVLAATTLALTGCGLIGGGETAAPERVGFTLGPPNPATDNQFALATVIQSGPVTIDYQPSGQAAAGVATPMGGNDPACAPLKEIYFPNEPATGTATGPLFQRDSGTTFAQQFTTTVETYSSPEVASRVITGLKSPNTALCIRRQYEPALAAATNGSLSPASTSVTVLPAFDGPNTAGVRLSGTAFAQRQTLAPALDVVAVQVDRAVLYGIFGRLDGVPSPELQQQVLAAMRAQGAAAVESRQGTPAPQS